MFSKKLYNIEIMNVPEQLFFKDSRANMEKIIGMSYPELAGANCLTLPDIVLHHTSNAVEGTLLDYHERGVTYGFRNKQLVAKDLTMGTDYNFRTRRAEVPGPNAFKQFWNDYFAEPSLIGFHTHPRFDSHYFESFGKERINTKIGLLPVAVYTATSSLASRYFSGTDLSIIESHPRSVRSELLGSARGYLWIINPNFNIPFIAQDIHAKRYEKRLFNFLSTEATQMVRDSNYQPEIEDFDKQIQEYLYQFCHDTNLVAFLNDDFRNPNLYRLSLV